MTPIDLPRALSDHAGSSRRAMRHSHGRRWMTVVGASVWTAALALTASAAEAPAREAVVVSAVENMYSAPQADKDVVSQALLGQVVAVLESRDGFARVETPDRYRGWMLAGAFFEYADPKAPRYATGGPVAEVTALMAN